jgi:hypothetical protein
MLPPELPPLPALTRAEAEFVDCYLEVLDLVGRINPARVTHTDAALRAAPGAGRAGGRAQGCSDAHAHTGRE